jgi:ParB-like chromosome segregation protein Spo0J
VSENKKFTKPIVVRKTEKENKYILVMGFTSCIVAKMLGLNEVPVVIRNTTHEDFIKKYRIVNS